jgi:hypothetical protein
MGMEGGFLDGRWDERMRGAMGERKVGEQEVGGFDLLMQVVFPSEVL